MVLTHVSRTDWGESSSSKSSDSQTAHAARLRSAPLARQLVELTRREGHAPPPTNAARGDTSRLEVTPTRRTSGVRPEHICFLHPSDSVIQSASVELESGSTEVDVESLSTNAGWCRVSMLRVPTLSVKATFKGASRTKNRSFNVTTSHMSSSLGGGLISEAIVVSHTSQQEN